MNNEFQDYRDIIKAEFEKRTNLNSNYSLRAFARDLNISVSSLSEVLNEKKNISIRSAIKIAENLNFTQSEAKTFCDLVILKNGSSKKEKQNVQMRIQEESHFYELSQELFKVISDWYHFAILELTKTKGFKSDSQWIAKKLGIKNIQVESAIERLKRFDLIKDNDGTIQPTNAQLTTSEGIPSRAIRKFNSQILDKAKESIELQNVNERHLSTLTIAVSEEDYDEITREIQKFNRRINSLIENKTKSKKNVYCLSTQLFKLNHF